MRANKSWIIAMRVVTIGMILVGLAHFTRQNYDWAAMSIIAAVAGAILAKN